MAVVEPNKSGRSNNCVPVKMWTYELRRVLLLQTDPNVKIRISQCPEPMCGCGCSDSDKGSTDSLECPERVSSPTRGEWMGEHGMVGPEEGSTESVEFPEGVSSPM